MFIQGYYEQNTETYVNGIVPKIFKKFISEQTNKNCSNWVVADGPIDSSWTDDFNPVLDDNMKLTLFSGELIKMNENIKMIFETDSLDNCSPDLVSRSGVLLLESNTFTFKNLIAY
jgi:hypothetical protein